jgi:ArsR family transcriptional regulator, arsenate/arsenite/antimonite-responsive transcriptional repressor
MFDMTIEIAEFYKALANPIRLRVFMHIAKESEGSAPTLPKLESCVTAISKQLRIPQPTVSNHLKVLKEAGLVKSVSKDTHCYQYVTKDAAKLLLDQSKYVYQQANKNPY